MAERLTSLDYLMPDVDERRVYETRIASNLHAGQALFSAALQQLYFCDSPDQRIESALQRVFATSGRSASIETVKLDDFGVFAVGRKLELDAAMKPRVYAALRLMGVVVRSG